MDADEDTAVSVRTGKKRASDQRGDSRSAKKQKNTPKETDPDYVPEHRGRKEVNAQSFLQQVCISWLFSCTNFG